MSERWRRRKYMTDDELANVLIDLCRRRRWDIYFTWSLNNDAKIDKRPSRKKTKRD